MPQLRTNQIRFSCRSVASGRAESEEESKQELFVIPLSECINMYPLWLMTLLKCATSHDTFNYAHNLTIEYKTGVCFDDGETREHPSNVLLLSLSIDDCLRGEFGSERIPIRPSLSIITFRSEFRAVLPPQALPAPNLIAVIPIIKKRRASKRHSGC